MADKDWCVESYIRNTEDIDIAIAVVRIEGVVSITSAVEGAPSVVEDKCIVCDDGIRVIWVKAEEVVEKP